MANTTGIRAGRYQSLSQYVRDNNLDYQKTRNALITGKSRKQHYRVGRAWIVKA